MKYLNLPTLDETVLAALEFFNKKRPTTLKIDSFSFPIVVGSGNAYNTAQIIFSGRKAIIASESNFKEILNSYQDLIKNKTISEAIIISASGEKDSVWEIKLAKKYKLKTVLLTCNIKSSAAKIANEVILYEKLPEPYTYNVSTYLGMLISTKKEEVKDIKKVINSLKLPNLKKYQAYSFILPDKFAFIAPMLEIKRDELFGSNLSLRAFSYGQARHAKFVNNSEKELVISLGENEYFGLKKNRWEIKIPKNSGNSLIMALAYYLVGQIQKNKPPYFKKNIAKFCLEGPRAYGKNESFEVIVK